MLKKHKYFFKNIVNELPQHYFLQIDIYRDLSSPKHINDFVLIRSGLKSN